ncbi:MAG: aminotransferase class I/II-fold pyridoxal phosphate-dependent enzyme, partial [Oscillospiraceae bacterium]|nr:aminotransferase class I/II-fold pyridoxal phosphate-dependent enzyme [Oscillospiraceae bacterium]
MCGVREMKLDQSRAPLYEAMREHRLNRVVPFDVPGHKGGRGNRTLTEFLGENCLKNDVNSMKPLDNLCHPVSVIKQAQELAADAFGAENAIFIVNGATGAVQAMIMSLCKSGDKIILPRNVHRSAINALVVCGAVPVYVNPGVNGRLGIPLGMTPEEVE